MSLAEKTLHLCSCNGTMPIDAATLARALELSGTPAVKSMLCQKELGAFADRSNGDVVVPNFTRGPVQLVEAELEVFDGGAEGP